MRHITACYARRWNVITTTRAESSHTLQADDLITVKRLNGGGGGDDSGRNTDSIDDDGGDDDGNKGARTDRRTRIHSKREVAPARQTETEPRRVQVRLLPSSELRQPPQRGGGQRHWGLELTALGMKRRRTGPSHELPREPHVRFRVEPTR